MFKILRLEQCKSLERLVLIELLLVSYSLKNWHRRRLHEKSRGAKLSKFLVKY